MALLVFGVYEINGTDIHTHTEIQTVIVRERGREEKGEVELISHF